MLASSQHVYSHQQYPGPQHNDWHQNPHVAHEHARAQAAQAAASAAQQHPYGRLAANTMNGATEHAASPANQDSIVTEENKRVLEYIAQLMSVNTREAALLELSKKREQVPELALVLWHSFGNLISTLSTIQLEGVKR
jgi:CCR4-NOT transcription complex subunit 9